MPMICRVLPLRILLSAALVLAMLIIAVPARAQNCSATNITSLDFGSIDVTANTPFTTSGTYTASCSGIVLSAVRTCPNIGIGTGGNHASGAPRYLLNGSHQLAFNLYQDAGFATIWGSYPLGLFTAPTVDITLVILGSGSATRTIFARIPNGQQTLPAGTYVSSFAGVHTSVAYAAYTLALPALAPPCTTLTSPSVTAPFTVTATIVANCSVSATALDFGSAGLLDADVDDTNALSVTCTALTPYTISLDGGLSGATNPALRKMTKGAETVTYGLYRDAARSLAWGSTIGVDTVSSIGTGLAENHTVYGRVAPQPTPSPGTYTDTIVVLVSY
jgi:spore coat protein U-like protein